MTILEQRQAVAVEAKTWLGTKFHNHAHIKGAGVDCAWLIADTYNVALGAELKVWPYPPQWFQHRSEERTPPPGREYLTGEWYIEDLQRAGFIEISKEKMQVGDVVLSQIARAYCHGGIIVGWPGLVHAESTGKMVILTNAECDSYYVDRNVKFFSWGAWHGSS